jgi:FkbM family methyltransferase
MDGLIKPLFREPVMHLYRLITEPDYFTYCRLASQIGLVKRYSPRTVRFQNWSIHVPDALSFIYMYREIFVYKVYDFPAVGKTPRILDLGANIGLAVLFWKRKYPGARITAVEPDPVVFNYLKKNINGNVCKDVTLINKAVWNKTTTIDFYADGADTGSIHAHDNAKTISVPAVDVRELLRNERFDFIKMDIEGSENVVLPACRDYLADIPYIFIEYHSRAEEKQSLGDILEILRKSGFRFHLHAVRPSPTPFLHRTLHDGFDMQLNIFGWREEINVD